jgi:hemerythrin
MGKFFVWKPEYSVGILKIDDQHKRLLDIINELYTAFTENKTKERLGEILKMLLDYTEYHFSSEEQLFVEAQYEKKSEHIEEHKDFVLTIKQFMQDYNNGKGAVTYKLMNFLRNWLINHIQVNDQKYAEKVIAYLGASEQTH